ncbi:6504_t:CDS:1 [Dentiscutata erythropus]|uniref:6504_t:CDS:1 n=1 Tax=Dentiscutata erythropus TaxID=1348616 RepID=A0A9N9CT64_9GLOM|nr:6504_t:CDS:1 [Dentiscutata erythropus]
MGIMRNRLRPRAHVTNACTNCKHRRKKCSGTFPCSNCKKRKLECVFIKSNERRGRKPRPRASSSNKDELNYLNRDLSTLSSLSTLITPQASTNASWDGLQTDITNTTTYDELSHSGFPIVPLTEPNQAIPANNDYSISFTPISFTLDQAVSTNNISYYSTSNQIISLNDVHVTNELFHEYQFHDFLLPETCEHDITNDPISSISQIDSLHLETCNHNFMNGSVSIYETDTIYSQQPTLQPDPLQLDSFTNDPCGLNSLTLQSELLEQTHTHM